MQNKGSAKTTIINMNQSPDIEAAKQKKWSFKKSKKNQIFSEYRFPLDIFPAYGNTFIIRNTYQDKYEHIRSDGTLMKQRIFKGGKLFMMSDTKAMVWSQTVKEEKYYLHQWDLQSDQIIQVDYQNISKGSNSGSIITYAFSESKLFCIVENNQKGNLLNIRYYQFPIQNKKDKPIYQQVFELKYALDRKYRMKKLNNHSALIWRNWDQEIVTPYYRLFTFDLNSPTNKIEEHKFHHGIKLQQMFKIKIVDVWQFSQQKIYVKLQVKADCPQFAKKYKNLNAQERDKIGKELLKQQKCHEFIWNIKTKSCNVPQFLSSITEKQNNKYHVQFINSLRQLKMLQLDCEDTRFDLFTKLDQRMKVPQFKYKMKNICFVDPQSEQIMAIQQFQKSNISPQSLGYYFSNSSGKLYYQLHLKKTKNQIQVGIQQFNVNGFIYNKQIYFTFLILGLFKGNCDQDLIYHAVNLIEEQNIVEEQKNQMKQDDIE